MMKTKGASWKWAWCISGSAVALQFYFVRELIAAFAFFAIGFAALALVIVTLYILQKGWEVAVERMADGKHLAGQSLQPEQSVRWTP